MIVKIASNPRQRLQQWNIYSLQLSFVSDTGLHQQLWCMDRAERDNDFTRGFGTKSFSLVLELNTRRATALE
jgi:hypothetical protein